MMIFAGLLTESGTGCLRHVAGSGERMGVLCVTGRTRNSVETGAVVQGVPSSLSGFDKKNASVRTCSVARRVFVLGSLIVANDLLSWEQHLGEASESRIEPNDKRARAIEKAFCSK